LEEVKLSYESDKVSIEDRELLYDLRQSFVVIVTEIKKQIVFARASQIFPVYYNLLDSLYIEVSKNLSEEEIKEYESLREKATTACRKYSLSYLKKENKDSNIIYESLRTLDVWINRKMNEKNMFGSKDIDDATGL